MRGLVDERDEAPPEQGPVEVLEEGGAVAAARAGEHLVEAVALQAAVCGAGIAVVTVGVGGATSRTRLGEDTVMREALGLAAGAGGAARRRLAAAFQLAHLPRAPLLSADVAGAGVRVVAVLV